MLHISYVCITQETFQHCRKWKHIDTNLFNTKATFYHGKCMLYCVNNDLPWMFDYVYFIFRCYRFPLDNGSSGVCKLNISSGVHQPDLVYSIGVEVCKGQGIYSNTNIATFAPRFLLDNRSSHKLAFAQRHMIETNVSHTEFTLVILF